MALKEQRDFINPLGLGYDVVEIIEAVKEERPPVKIRNIAKKLGVTEDYVRRRIKKLESKGFGFRANFDLRKLGLSTIAVFFDRPIEFDPETRIKGIDKNLAYILRWHGNIAFPKPLGIALFYVPNNVEVKEELVHQIGKSGVLNVADAIEMDISRYDDLNLKDEIAFSRVEKRWKNVTSKIIREGKGSSNSMNAANLVSPVEVKHVDLIDLIILARLQNDALTPISEIAKVLNVSVSKINRHLRTHIMAQDIIEKNSLRKRTIITSDPTNIVLVVKGKTKKLSLLDKTITEVSKIFEFVSSLHNPRTGDFIVLFLIKADDIEKIEKYIHKIFGEVLDSDYFIGILNKSSIKSYTIPFISFNREERDWDLDQQLMDLMRQKLLDILRR